MSTITPAQEQTIREYFAQVVDIPAGLGTKKAACSIGGINLALTGRLTGIVPECMSQVIGRWIIGVQDAMPAAMRNSPEWRELLPLAAGTGRDRERERLDMILDWMWGIVLPSFQSTAEADGYGDAWREMCACRTSQAAAAAYDAYDAANTTPAAAATAAYYASLAYDTASAVSYSDDSGATGADMPAYYAALAATGATSGDYWRRFDPVGLLRGLIAVGETAP